MNHTRTDFQLHSSGVFPLGRVVTAGTLINSEGVPTTEPFRKYPRFALMILLAGTGTYSEPDAPPIALTPGSVVIVFPGKPHTYRATPGTRWDEFYVVLEGPAFEAWARQGVLDRSTPVFHTDDPYGFLSQFQIEVSATRQDPLVQVCRFQLWVANLLNSSNYQVTRSSADFVHRAKLHLASDLELELDLSQLAEQMGMSYESFRHRFRKDTGVAPYAFRYTARMEAAAEMLALTKLKNATIAAQLGFATEHHFSAAFKKRYRVSPRTYRSQRQAVHNAEVAAEA